MSSISGLGSLGSVGGSMRFGPPGGMKGMNGMSEPPAEMRQKFESMFKSAAKEAGIDTDKFADIQSQIQSKVGDVLKNADGSSDIRASIDDAVNGVLKDNGIDPEEFKSKMESVFNKMGAPTPGSGGYDRTGAAGGQGFGSSAANSKNELLSKLLSQLGGDSAGGFFGSMPAGSLLDAAA